MRIFQFGITAPIEEDLFKLLNSEYTEIHDVTNPSRGNLHISHMFELNNLKHKFNSNDLITIVWNVPNVHDTFYDKQWMSGKLPAEVNIAENNIFKDLRCLVGVIKTIEHLGCKQYHKYNIDSAKSYLDSIIAPEHHDRVDPVIEYIKDHVNSCNDFI